MGSKKSRAAWRESPAPQGRESPAGQSAAVKAMLVCPGSGASGRNATGGKTDEYKRNGVVCKGAEGGGR